MSRAVRLLPGAVARGIVSGALVAGALAAGPAVAATDAGASAPAATPAATPSHAETWARPADPIRIVGPLWYVGTQGLGVYLITTPSGHILIDGAIPEAAPLVEASIRKAGFRPEEIRLLLNTHAHADHAGTIAHFKKLSGARLAVMRPDDRLLKSGGAKDYLFTKNEAFHFPPVTADQVLEDGDTVTVGDVTLTARHTPGHTRGCTTWIGAFDDAGKTYFVVFPGSTSVNPGTRFVNHPSYRGIADDYRRAFEVLASFRPDVFLTAHPGAMEFETKRARAAAEGPQAFVDPDGYRRYVAESKARFEALVAGEGAGGS